MLILLMAVSLSACASVEVGQKFDKAAANKIEIGKTTEGEIQLWLGEPLQKITKEDGSKIYGYGYKESQVMAFPFVARGTATGDKLVVGINPQGIVSSVERGMLPSDQTIRKKRSRKYVED